jgi:hypothetical protein
MVLTHAVERMHVHELRKTLAWYSRGLRGGSDLRQRASADKNAQNLMRMGEAFFEMVVGAAHAGDAVVTNPADPVAKSIARQDRLRGVRSEADECAA